MPPKRCTSSVVSSTIASMMSSTVQMPSTRPDALTTGTARRSYLEISRATSSRSVERRDGYGPATRRDRKHAGIRVAGDQPAQRHRLHELLGLWIENYRSHRPSRACARPCGYVQASARRSNWPARLTNSVVMMLPAVSSRIREQPLQIDGARLGIEPAQKIGAAFLLEMTENIGDAVRRHAGGASLPQFRRGIAVDDFRSDIRARTDRVCRSRGPSGKCRTISRRPLAAV